MSGVAKKGTFNIVHRINLDDDFLKKIADALDIPEAERSRIISGEIVISGPPTTHTASGGGGSQTTSGEGSSQATPGGSTAPSSPGGHTRAHK
jgi:hypothetical protein